MGPAHIRHGRAGKSGSSGVGLDGPAGGRGGRGVRVSDNASRSRRTGRVATPTGGSDPAHSPNAPSSLMSRSYLAERVKHFSADRAGAHNYGTPSQPRTAATQSTSPSPTPTKTASPSSTPINNGFGSCIIPQGCGFTLQNHGSNFEIGIDDHPNIYKVGKRPYHTIIPGMITHGYDSKTSTPAGDLTSNEDLELHSVFSVMGGFMQPQGHLQVLLNMEVFHMNPQQALDAPRICIGAGMPTVADSETGGQTVFVEERMPEDTIQGLKKLGHGVEVLRGWERSMFGRGQIIRQHWDGEEEERRRVWSMGSDRRGDGCAIPARNTSEIIRERPSLRKTLNQETKSLASR
jgi:gamma-glutamyltranspeptidase / glutathione hydrolase